MCYQLAFLSNEIDEIFANAPITRASVQNPSKVVVAKAFTSRRSEPSSSVDDESGLNDSDPELGIDGG
jgi:hypothetical protein